MSDQRRVTSGKWPRLLYWIVGNITDEPLIGQLQSTQTSHRLMVTESYTSLEQSTSLPSKLFSAIIPSTSHKAKQLRLGMLWQQTSVVRMTAWQLWCCKLSQLLANYRGERERGEVVTSQAVASHWSQLLISGLWLAKHDPASVEIMGFPKLLDVRLNFGIVKYNGSYCCIFRQYYGNFNFLFFIFIKDIYQL